MLIMKCPKCDKYISSALLAEIAAITCEHCGVEVPVRNVLITSNGFTFDRHDLLKRFYRYRKLLDEVIDERNALANNSKASAVSKRSVEQFLAILQGMMTGARDNFRFQFSDPVHTKLHYGRHSCDGIFYNLSMEGACVEIDPSNPLPRVKGDITIVFSLPNLVQVFSVGGEICWTKKARDDAGRRHSVGIKFSELDSATGASLWQFISGSTSRIFAEK